MNFNGEANPVSEAPNVFAAFCASASCPGVGSDAVPVVKAGGLDL